MRRLRVVLIAIAVFVLLAGLSTWWAKKRAESALLSFATHVDQVRQAALNTDGPAARDSLSRAHHDLDRARSARHWPTVRAASALPWFRSSTTSFDRFELGCEELYAAAAQATGAVDFVDGGGDAAGRRLVKDGVVDLAFLGQMKVQTEGALANIERAKGDIERVGSFPLLPGLPRARTVALEQIERTRHDFEGVPSVLDRLPAILGANEPRTYYLGLQNEAELRGSGGGLLVYVLVHADKGKITVENYGSVYAFETEDPGLRHPFDFEWMPDDIWSASIPDTRRLGNTNWSPQFPSVAHNVVELFRVQTGGRTIDGVVAVTPRFLDLMLKVVGPVTVEGRAEPFTADNLTPFIIKDAYGLLLPNGDPDQEKRRAINAQLLEETLKRLLATPDMSAFWQGVRPLVPDRSLQAYLVRPQEQQLVKQLGLDGAIADTDADYSSLVINNAAGNKADYYVSHAVDQDVTLAADGRAQEVLTHRMRNSGPPQPRDTRLPEYFDHFSDAFTAAYITGRAEVASIEMKAETIPSPLPEVGEEGGKTAVVRGMRVQPGDEGTYTVRYAVPSAGVRGADGTWTYRLVRQRPPRLDPDTFSVRVHLPPGATPVDTTGWSQEGDAWVARADVVGVSTFELRYRT